MARGKVDFIDLVAYPLFLIGSLAELGMVSFTIMGYDPTSSLVSLGPQTSLSLAMVLGVLALAIVIGTNKPKLTRGRGAIQLWVVVATFSLLIGPSFMPLLENLLTNDVAAITAFLVQTGGYMTASFLG